MLNGEENGGLSLAVRCVPRTSNEYSTQTQKIWLESDQDCCRHEYNAAPPLGPLIDSKIMVISGFLFECNYRPEKKILDNTMR